jgi:hypothetical protein
MTQVSIIRLKAKAMNDSTKDNSEKERVLRKLIKKWRSTQEMKGKAYQILSRNPGFKTYSVTRNRKAS